MNRIVAKAEAFFFGHRWQTFGVIGVFTAVMAVFALQLHMSAGFEKQMPIGHEYIQTFEKYRGDLFGANRLNFVVKAKSGTIWNQDALTRLYDVTQEVIYLPGVDRVGVQSLWTPNTYVNEITEEGFRADQIIESTITPEALTPEIISRIQKLTGQGGFVGTLVSHDQTSAMITAEISEIDREGKKLDYVAYNRILEEKIRKKFEDGKYEIQIIGFAKQIGEIADGAAGVLEFCGIALLLTGFAVYWYCRSVRFTVLPLVCSLTSLVWQFGTLRLLGFGLDPLAVLVPFLVFAIGVSHGIQQINFIVRGLAFGKTTEEAARESFTGLLIPGTLALVTAIVSFITLVLIPIPMVRELAITASIGVMYKIVTNLLMLPLAASCFTFTKEYAEGAMLKREGRSRWLHALARVAEPRNAVIVVLITTAIFGMSVWKSRGRVIGTLQPGAPELRPESRFNRDAVAISKGYDMGLDWLTVVFEAPPESDRNVALGGFVDDFTWKMANVPGVMSVDSYSNQLRLYNEGYNEGNPKMSVVPIDPMNSAGLSAEIARLRGYMNKDASMTAAHIYLTDHKAVTINGVIRAAKEFRSTHHLENVKVRLAAGNAGVQAAINDEVEKSELPMMLYVYAAILLLVFLVYRDLRAMLACCMPLAVGTFIGYWFMKELEIGLTVATLPVMVLAVGIGVDYAFYIYNRLQLHLGQGESIYQAMEKALAFEAMATIFTAITLAVGVVTWSFSPLKFQADMGKLLAFMFIVNMIMAMTALPALAVVLEKIFPRKGRVHVPEIMSHRAKDL
ncbi:MAG: MMPL family transporter [Candidatus Deferrimicrobium sp.]|nr:MMPL family transporter [Candidatus Deferrimicrobium sp.]